MHHRCCDVHDSISEVAERVTTTPGLQKKLLTLISCEAPRDCIERTPHPAMKNHHRPLVILHPKLRSLQLALFDTSANGWGAGTYEVWNVTQGALAAFGFQLAGHS